MMRRNASMTDREVADMANRILQMINKGAYGGAMWKLKDELASEFGRRRGWRVFNRGFSLQRLSAGSWQARLTRDMYDLDPTLCDHPTFYSVGPRYHSRPAAIVANLYDCGSRKQLAV